MELQKEIFKDVEGYEGILQVSNTGKVKKLKHTWFTGNKNSKRSIDEYIMKPRLNKGYNVIDVSLNGVKKILKVHRLIAIAFIPNPENKKFINHKDLDRSNNDLENLEWCTSKENAIHARKNREFKKHFNHAKGESVATSKLTTEQVLQIRETNLSNKEIAVQYSVDPSTISRIKSNNYWKHI